MPSIERAGSRLTPRRRTSRDRVRAHDCRTRRTGTTATEGEMTEHDDRDELVELMSRYANVPDTQNWDELPRSVFCDEFTVDFSSLGVPVRTFSRDAWCQRTKQVFAGWTATHHAITNHRITVD